jgi:hypothetical protein
MSVYGGPETVDSGLILSLDAANRRSAPAGTTTWTDLTNNALNGTLTNGPVYTFGRSAISCSGSAGNRLEIAHTTALNLNGGAYTIECWVYPTGSSFPSFVTLLGKQSGFTANPTAGYSIWINSGYPAFGLNGGYNSITSSTILILNRWQHIAVVSDGSSYTRLYLDGVQVGTSATLLTTSTSLQFIINGGSTGVTWNSDYPFTGLISDVRIVKGTAVYTGAFIRPSVPLTAIANTQLLTCNSPTIADSSFNAFAISTIGTMSVNNTTVSEVFFDGTNDFVTFSSAKVSSNLTITAWIKTTSTKSTSNQASIPALPIVGETAGSIWYSLGVHSGKLRYINAKKNGVWSSYDSTASVNNGVWRHVAVTHSSSTEQIRLYVDGALDSTFDNSATGSWPTYFSLYMTATKLGTSFGSLDFFSGSMSAVKIYDYLFSADEVLRDYSAIRGRYGL